MVKFNLTSSHNCGQSISVLVTSQTSSDFVYTFIGKIYTHNTTPLWLWCIRNTNRTWSLTMVDGPTARVVGSLAY
jgi:hypothetical protein